MLLPPKRIPGSCSTVQGCASVVSMDTAYNQPNNADTSLDKGAQARLHRSAARAALRSAQCDSTAFGVAAQAGGMRVRRVRVALTGRIEKYLSIPTSLEHGGAGE